MGPCACVCVCIVCFPRAHRYDFETGQMHKLQSAFAFPTCLKLHRYMAQRGGVGAGDKQPPPVYQLQAVLSHVGDAGGGHYVAYVRPRGSKQWYEFDDTRVTPVPEDVAVRQQYGGHHSARGGGGLFGWGQKPNAYMLVYVRRDYANKPVREGAAGPAESAFEPAAAELLPASVRQNFESVLRGGHPGRKRGKNRGRTAVTLSAAETTLEEEELESFFG